MEKTAVEKDEYIKELKRILQYQAKNRLVQQDVFEDIECEEDDEDSWNVIFYFNENENILK